MFRTKISGNKRIFTYFLMGLTTYVVSVDPKILRFSFFRNYMRTHSSKYVIIDTTELKIKKNSQS